MGKTILLLGACGSGKTTLMTVGYRALEVHWGPTATIDTDTILMMVDPRWDLAHEERRLELAGYQCWLLAESFLTAGFDCVIIGGNGLHTPEEVNDQLMRLLRLGEVYHVTLDPSLSEIQRRVANRGSDKTAGWDDLTERTTEKPDELDRRGHGARQPHRQRPRVHASRVAGSW